MKIGYARVSTADQDAGLESQLRDLKAAGARKVFQEKLSSVDDNRVALAAALDFCREGDTLICCKLDRLARSVADIVKIEAALREKGAALYIIDPAMETETPSGRLIFNMLASIAQFEREIMLQRQREGIAKAKREGKYIGRAKTAQSRAAEVLALRGEGFKAEEIADRLGRARNPKGKLMKISARSVYRILAEARAT